MSPLARPRSSCRIPTMSMCPSASSSPIPAAIACTCSTAATASMSLPVGDEEPRGGREVRVVPGGAKLVDRAGPFVGWANGDAFVIDGTSQYGGLTVRSSIVSRPLEAGHEDPKDRPGDGLSLSGPGSCHA